MRPDNFVGRVEGGELFLGKKTQSHRLKTEEILGRGLVPLFKNKTDDLIKSHEMDGIEKSSGYKWSHAKSRFGGRANLSAGQQV